MGDRRLEIAFVPQVLADAKLRLKCQGGIENNWYCPVFFPELFLPVGLFSPCCGFIDPDTGFKQVESAFSRFLLDESFYFIFRDGGIVDPDRIPDQQVATPALKFLLRAARTGCQQQHED